MYKATVSGNYNTLQLIILQMLKYVSNSAA